MPEDDGFAAWLLAGYRRHAAIIVMLVGYAALLTWAAERFMSRFPGSYVWTEDMINYAGGFVRRGLLGEIAFRLDSVIPTAWFIAGLVTVLYLLVGVWFVLAAMKRPTLGSVALLLSPVATLYPVEIWDAFGRKDVFIMAAVTGSIVAAQQLPRRWALVSSILLHVVIGFVVETAWFYFPLSIAAVGQLTNVGRDIRSQFWHWGPAGLLALIFAGTSALWGQVSLAQTGEIADSWRQIYPWAFQSPGALRGLTWSLAKALEVVRWNQSDGVGLGFLIGFALACLPLILIRAEGSRNVPSPGLPRLMILFATASLLIPFALGADWGRFTSLFVVSLGAYLLATRMTPISPATQFRSRTAIIEAGLIALYATSWNVLHYVEHINPLVPGLVFKLAGAAVHIH